MQKKTLKRGILIAIEGIDGAGKTTQVKILQEKMNTLGYSSTILHEPTRGKWGMKIRELAINGRSNVTPEEELELFYLDRIEDVEFNIKPALQEKKIVIMDRYYLSTVAYQGQKGLDPYYIEKKNKEIAPIPDVSIILDITSEEALDRIKFQRNEKPNHFEKLTYLQKVRSIYLEQFEGRENVYVIDGDGSRSIEAIASEIWNIVESTIQKVEDE